MDPTSTTPTKCLDSETDTPPHVQVQPINSSSFTYGKPKNHQQELHHHPHLRPPPPVVVATYKECLKNHAASIGGHAVDGCGEFMPSSTVNGGDPTSLKCAACGCHRNFHRREPDECYSSPTPISSNTPTPHFLDFQRHTLQQSRKFSPSPSPPPSLKTPMLLALSKAANDDQNRLPSPVTPTTGKAENLRGRKRFRTRFTQVQKEKMLCFAEKMKWKMPRSDESAGVDEFCSEVGVTRGVLKVWMHNNKHTVGKKDSNTNHLNNNNGVVNVKVTDFQNNGYSDVDKNGENSNNGGAHLHVSANGSSPSSS